MKDIKSIIIGFLLATSMFLLMGQTSNNNNIEKILRDINLTLIQGTKDINLTLKGNEIGKYQAFNGENRYIIDSTTGAMYKYKGLDEQWMLWTNSNSPFYNEDSDE